MTEKPRSFAIVGAGPAGLTAAEHLATHGHAVTVYDRMPSPARKLLLAGRGGLNLTHSETLERFLTRYGESPAIAAAITSHPPAAVRAWADGLGEDTFIGTSGRVFPKSFKATPLVRAWLRRLGDLGVTFRFRHRWTGWAKGGALTFDTPGGPETVTPDATLLALGGASWPRMGSDGGWQAVLAAEDIALTSLTASNAGALVDWSEIFRDRNAGAPMKGFAWSLGGQSVRAEAVVTRTGLEGGAIYALSGALRTTLDAGRATLTIDLKPEMTTDALTARLAGARKGETLSNILRKQAGLPPVAIGLLREGAPLPNDPGALAAAIKRVSLPVTGLAPLARAISSAGGIAASEIEPSFMLTKKPGVFVAGEMLDWDAPTGGYLLQACFATAIAAARGMEAYASAPIKKPRKRAQRADKSP